MKILMLTPYVPFPPSSGGQIRSLNLLKYLSQNNRITLIALYKKEKEKKSIKHLKKYCRQIYLCKRPKQPWQITNIIKAILSPFPFLVIRNFSQEAKKIVQKLIESHSYDVIHAETFYIMPHLPKTKTPVLLVEQTIEYQVYQHFVRSLPFIIRPLFYLDIVKLKFWERFYWKKATLVATVSQPDRKKLLSLEPGIKTTIIPNGAGDDMLKIKLSDKNLTKPIILFLGNFDWLQNIEAAKIIIKAIHPKIKKHLPKIKIIIAGQNAKKKLPFSPQSKLQIVDIPPDDKKTVEKLYKKATLFIAPINGPGGTRLKLLAAMAAGVPIIATKTALQGLDLTYGKNVLIAKQPEEFIQQIKLILSEKSLFKKIQKNAYYLVRKKYNWKDIADKLQQVYSQVKNEDLS